MKRVLKKIWSVISIIVPMMFFAAFVLSVSAIAWAVWDATYSDPTKTMW
jgi:hypothetical protein